MAADPSVAARITQLKTKWDTFTSPADILKAPGSVTMLMPVDATSAIRVSVPGRVIKLLGISKDVTGGKFAKIYQGLSKPKATSVINRRPRAARSVNKSKLIYTKEIIINLKTPVAYTINSTKVEKNRKLTQLILRVPQVVSYECVTWWLYNEPATTNRPFTFESDNKIYQVWDIPITSLGELPDTAEKPEASQSETGEGATLQV
jgi:hypothetical protein